VKEIKQTIALKILREGYEERYDEEFTEEKWKEKMGGFWGGLRVRAPEEWGSGASNLPDSPRHNPPTNALKLTPSLSSPSSFSSFSRSYVEIDCSDHKRTIEELHAALGLGEVREFDAEQIAETNWLRQCKLREEGERMREMEEEREKQIMEKQIEKQTEEQAETEVEGEKQTGKEKLEEVAEAENQQKQTETNRNNEIQTVQKDT
jgi:hypothetical protein